MKRPDQARIFIGPIEVAGYYAQLSAGLRQRGHTVTHVGATIHKFRYKDSNPPKYAVRIYNRLITAALLPQTPDWARRVIKLLANTTLMVWAIPTHDTFIFGAACTFLPFNIDLPLLRACGKKTICYIGHGSESRPPYLNGALRDNDGRLPSTTQYRSMTKSRARQLAWIERFATYSICSPLTAHFLGRRFINSYVFGVPFSYVTPAPPPMVVRISGSPTRILHAPSRRHAKGSDRIAAAITHLREKGHAIDYVELHGVSHETVMGELLSCDFVIDQAYSDYPLAGMATEAAFFGKAAIVGGYCWDALRSLIPADNWPPSLLCHPDDLESIIEDWLLNPEHYRRLGDEARDFVSTKWTPQLVADRYRLIIHDQIPPDWWRNPADTPFSPGGFAEIDVHRQVIRDLLKCHGSSSLRVDDKPALRDALLKFAHAEEASPPCSVNC